MNEKSYSVDSARELGRNKSTISRKIRSKSAEFGSADANNCRYSALEAQRKYHQNRQRSRRKKKILSSDFLKVYSGALLDRNWSPEQIAARLKLEIPHIPISFITIYRAIHAGLLNRPGDTRKQERHLRMKGKNGKKSSNDRRGACPIDHTLEEHLKEVQQRERIGDIETDTVLGKADGQCLAG